MATYFESADGNIIIPFNMVGGVVLVGVGPDKRFKVSLLGGNIIDLFGNDRSTFKSQYKAWLDSQNEPRVLGL